MESRHRRAVHEGRGNRLHPVPVRPRPEYWTARRAPAYLSGVRAWIAFRWALICLIAAAGIGALAAHHSAVMLLVLAVAAGVSVLVFVMLPKRMTFAPWRITLPPLVIYTALSLWLERPPTLGIQIQWLSVYVTAFLLAGAFVHLAVSPNGGAAATSYRGPLNIHRGVLRGAMTVGLLVYVYVYSSTGVPVLSGDAAAARLELAAPGLAGIWITGRALLQLTLIMDLLHLAGVVRIQSKRLRFLNIAVVVLVLLSSSGRSDLLNPIIITGLAVLLSGWRRIGRLLVAGAGAVGLFLLGGILREGVETPLGPGINYLVGTAQINDRIARTFPDAIPHPSGRIFFWFFERLSGDSAIPPGIFLKELAGRTETFVGFGLETNVLGALWLDWGLAGLLVGGAIIGGVAHLLYLRWRAQGGWWSLTYATGLTFLLLGVANHPIASYWYLLFPACLTLFWVLNSAFLRAAGPRGFENAMRASRRPVLVAETAVSEWAPG
jgi:hypothetical protein